MGAVVYEIIQRLSLNRVVNMKLPLLQVLAGLAVGFGQRERWGHDT
jgi:hypothetical protein